MELGPKFLDPLDKEYLRNQGMTRQEMYDWGASAGQGGTTASAAVFWCPEDLNTTFETGVWGDISAGAGKKTTVVAVPPCKDEFPLPQRSAPNSDG